MTKKKNRETASVQSPRPTSSAQPTEPRGRIQGKEREPQSISRKAGALLALAVTLALVVLGAFHLVVRNSDMLFMAQNKSFFSSNPAFLRECMSVPGGFISWTASYLTQFFYYPILGSAMMIGIWVVSLWVSKLAFNVRTEWMAVLLLPAVCLLVSTIDTGYWLYYLKQTGYWFYGTIGYLATVLLVLFYSLFRKRADRIIIFFLIALTYPFIGWYALLALVYATCLTVRRQRNEGLSLGRQLIQPSLALLLLVAVPLVCYYLYSDVRIEDMWTIGFPHFDNNNMTSLFAERPFIIMALTPLLFPFLPQQSSKGWMAWAAYGVTVLVLAGAVRWTEARDFQNYNYHAEMRMYRAAEECDWDKVLDEMGDLPGDADRQMVLLKNIALLNKGQLGTQMFRYNNMGEPPTNSFDTLNVHMVQTAAPLIYYYHGKTNFTVRWCIENCVEFGNDFDNIKMLARCALVGGEMDAAKKYLDILASSTFHRQWAERLRPITRNPKLIAKYHEFDTVRELRDHMGSVLDGDNGLCEMYLLNYFSNTMNKDSKLLQELTLNYALVQKDIQLFWPRFFLYATLHDGEPMPIHYQEAAYLYGTLEPQNVDISKMPFDQQMVQHYQGFQQLSQQLLKSNMTPPQVGEVMKASYGGTFWWFYFFCRDIHSY